MVWLSSAWTRATYHYRFGRPKQAALRKRIREIAETRMRCGYRGIAVLLRRQGSRVNVKRMHRLYRLEGLQIRLNHRVDASWPSCGMSTPFEPQCRCSFAVSATLAAAASTLMTLARRFKVHARSVALREFNSGGL